MPQINVRFFLVTGEPGIGKTTLIKKLSESLLINKLAVDGFYTEGRRGTRGREGFDVVSIQDASKRCALATDLQLLSQPTQFKVGKYGVLIEEFQKIALPILDKVQSEGTSIVVIDEIGKMELFSQQFMKRVERVFSNTTRHIVLATIPIYGNIPLVEQIRTNACSKVFKVTRENRDDLLEEILQHIETTVINN